MATSARQLVVEPGDRVRAEGRFVQLDDVDWLDMAQIDDLVLRTRPWKSNRSARLVGADASAVPDGHDRTVRPGRLRVVGRWDGETITVETQSPVPWPGRTRRDRMFDLPAPADGWDDVDQSRDVDGLEELRASGAIVRDCWRRDSGGALILQVAASDVDAVERVLGAQLPRRLCVVASRYTAAQLAEVESRFAASAREWGFEAWSYQGLDAQCQPYAEVTLTRVSADLAAWADTLPDGLLTFHPAMTPAD